MDLVLHLSLYVFISRPQRPERHWLIEVRCFRSTSLAFVQSETRQRSTPPTRNASWKLGQCYLNASILGLGQAPRSQAFEHSFSEEASRYITVWPEQRAPGVFILATTTTPRRKTHLAASPKSSPSPVSCIHPSIPNHVEDSRLRQPPTRAREPSLMLSSSRSNSPLAPKPQNTPQSKDRIFRYSPSRRHSTLFWRFRRGPTSDLHRHCERVHLSQTRRSEEAQASR